MPKWGQGLDARRLRCDDLRLTNLRELFEKIEDRLHAEVADKSRRFEIMLQLLLTKLYDERIHCSSQQEMTIQDFEDAPLGDSDVLKIWNTLLDSAVRYYKRYLPKPVAPSFSLSGGMLRSLSSLLGPVRILGSKRDVVQNFYMYFAQGVYKWDLAQYFTPSEVVDFIVTLVNPQAGDQVKDPACGSGDFLVSSLLYAQQNGGNLQDAVWGADNSENAVQVCVLNMVLNGDGKSNITHEDSLAHVENDENAFSVMLCNPPFGVRIQERQFDTLRQFTLGHEWKLTNGKLQSTDKVLESQEVGLLFAELCVKQAAPGGRIGIILPNGYLGNRSLRYLAFREWLLQHTHLVAIVAFPRFTFKKSGADVSASVLVLEKRGTPLANATDSEDYPFYVGVLESVGWSVSDKRSERLFRRDPETGVYLTDSNNEYILDADFNRILRDVRGSKVVEAFPWLNQGIEASEIPAMGWSVHIRSILARQDLSIDPKRWCEKTLVVREQICAMPHFILGDVANIIPETGSPRDKSAVYEHVELQDAFDGVITPHLRRGWELPERARHTAQQGDIFVGRVWGSVGKWFVAGGDCSSLVVSNGFHRLQLKPEMQDYLVDILVGLNTEAYRVQARAFSTGSDGLAELPEVDLLTIVLPRVVDPAARTIMQPLADALLTGRTTVASVVEGLLKQGQIQTAHVQPRSTNWVQV